MDSRSPPNLLYLTIYNPTLRPADNLPTDDEDAEEQAHILFYTSKERAVSRDRMLRQVGLAKALVNFSDMFNPDDACNNIHSQGRRMVMVSPEPDFWITACVELAKTIRTPTVGRSKGKQKAKTGTTSKDVALVCDYQDSSVDDISLRTDICRGYEQFKLTHGSLTSILSALGQQALELQLERFFTPWAWAWNLDCDRGFGDHLGIPLHPQYRSLVPLLDDFASLIPTTASSIIVTPSHVIPSASFVKARYPSSFPEHLMCLIPPPPPPSPQLPPDSPVKKRPPDPEADTRSSSFLGMPTGNLNMNMDVRKWGWPGYLTFKGSAKRPEIPTAEVNPPTPKDGGEVENVEIDKSALDDAIHSDVISVHSTKPMNGDAAVKSSHGDESGESETSAGTSQSSSPGSLNMSLSADEKAVSQGSHDNSVESSTSSRDDGSSTSSKEGSISSPSLEPPPELSNLTVYLSDPPDGLNTRRSKVVYMTQHPVLVAVAGLEDADYDLSLAAKVHQLCMEVKGILDDNALTSSSTETLPSATKILQPKDRHLVSRAQFTMSNDKFAAKPEQFYIAQHLLESDPDVQEVFSRGMNPQHWHIAQRALNRDTDGDVYLEVSRKETSLSDVDNVLAGVVRRYSSVDVFLP
ncbi:uncharacterized protein EV420DRAFT_1507205 [Desarmillaria tabescens]|uniref:CCZ1/INTU/HSP4 first Longin domain-containing protein n=1 Tax=Armillaria tabescens TaxID=1929756 RepID=A0AA39NK68_ARMTA|nr:uncharacterized protein EV420DRAFT_1507205 [Desarmillaria tabescens]KAK0467105.1 hypothetical protein EV420DRAFT_1507205 [Desarmillaria tabescens]